MGLLPPQSPVPRKQLEAGLAGGMHGHAGMHEHVGWLHGRAILVTVILTAGIPALLNPGERRSSLLPQIERGCRRHGACAEPACMCMQATRPRRRYLTGTRAAAARDRSSNPSRDEP